ncbi:MAG: orotidine-5'-phosphate decarboxylase [Fimbriimonadaceae bacterium]|nr:orotidine-5'-phosphate decarboxylase [Fimbriimonadaceae bacterium]
MGIQRKVICALDTSSVPEAVATIRRLAPFVGGFKVGHALTLPHGLGVVETLRDAGAQRIFLDLKFHDIPNSVALAVREATRHGVWMMTLHASGGPAMMTAAVEEARSHSEECQPILLAVSVLTSLNQHILTDHMGTNRTIVEHMAYLSKLAVDCGMDGVVSSPEEIKDIRRAIGHAVIVSPGIRRPDQSLNDHSRTGTGPQALADGADYLVIGRGLMESPDPEKTLTDYYLFDAAGSH